MESTLCKRRSRGERALRITLKAPENWGSKPFKELLAEARDERYARLLSRCERGY